MNTLKTVVLLVLLTLIFVWAGAAFGGKQGMTIALLMAFMMNVFAYWFSDKMVLRMYGAREVTESEAPELFGIVRRLSQKAQMPLPRVYVIEEDQPNAFATGRNPEHAAVAVTTGIMRILSPEELTGVIGHELSRVRHRDILIGTIAATIAGAISYIAQIAQWTAIFGHRGDDDEGGSPLAALVMMIVGLIAALIVQMAISRSREYLADEGGARLSGNPRYLSRALRKLNAASQRIPMDANPATSHMFIVNPLSGGGIVRLFSTHPPIEERIARLDTMSL
ncbi:MAG TPA: zinc metalloprotease HtpX [Thermodesulfovibrionales bacterium]|jgi:heat shock protein HtpX|nr:zinc metalloprotease HtpX [Thermodesulfovibrionales bacterium]